VSMSLRVPVSTTFLRVTVPICLPAILDIAIYLFVNAMTTVSALIFFYGSNKPAAVMIVHMDEAGAIAAAAAMATLIVATSAAAKLLHGGLAWALHARFQSWRKR